MAATAPGLSATHPRAAQPARAPDAVGPAELEPAERGEAEHALAEHGPAEHPRAEHMSTVEAAAGDTLEEPAPLAARGLTRAFDGARGVFDLSLQVRAGRFVALIGPSGAGKTTLMRMLAGLDTPDAGAVLRDGVPCNHVRRGDTRVALVFQRPRLVGRLDALSNVVAGRLGHVTRWRGLLGRWHDDDLRLSIEALNQVGLAHVATDRADRLSGGEQQRVSIARALAQQPRVLLLDEPVASLDPDNARLVLEILRSCARRGLAVLASLHQHELAHEFADEVITLAAGRRLTSAAPEPAVAR
jgi:phosphonate transport system ATP-binding protein